MGLPSREERTVDDTLFLSLTRFPFLWSKAELSRIASEAAAWQPQFLDVDPVYGVVFARYCEQQRIRLPSLEFVLSSYEFLSINHRRVLERVFKVPVLDLYGSTETGHLLMEDETGRMSPSGCTAHLEIVGLDALGIGELVVTTLTNPFMPLIRYRIGDLAERREHEGEAHYVIHGRIDDAVEGQSGRRVTLRHIDECFTDLTGIVHYQLARRGEAVWRLNFVPDGEGPNGAALQELRRRLESLLEGRLEAQTIDVLLPQTSGKFRLVQPASTS